MSLIPVTVRLSKDKDHVLFFREPNTDEDDYFYYVPTGEIANNTGLENWLNHLREKEWFGPSIEREFMREAGK